jgi:hypothetical protein
MILYFVGCFSFSPFPDFNPKYRHATYQRKSQFWAAMEEHRNGQLIDVYNQGKEQ